MHTIPHLFLLSPFPTPFGTGEKSLKIITKNGHNFMSQSACILQFASLLNVNRTTFPVSQWLMTLKRNRKEKQQMLYYIQQPAGPAGNKCIIRFYCPYALPWWSMYIAMTMGLLGKLYKYTLIRGTYDIKGVKMVRCVKICFIHSFFLFFSFLLSFFSVYSKFVYVLSIVIFIYHKLLGFIWRKRVYFFLDIHFPFPFILLSLKDRKDRYKF